ncbi:MAG: cupin domain-containing protein [Rhodanobacteraceae bacterium]
MPKLDLDSVRRRTGTSYPAPFDQPCLTRVRRALGDAGGINDFGVNLLELAPGAWSSQRHWHSGHDEFVWVVSGEVVLVEDGGETILRGRLRRIRKEQRKRASPDQPYECTGHGSRSRNPQRG